MDLRSQYLSQIIWQFICHLAAIMPAGVLLGTAFILNLPLNNQAEIVAAALLIMSSAITILINKAAFWELHFGRFAMFAAFGHTVVRTPRLIKAPSFGDELVSCLREYGVTMAVVSFAIAMMMPDASMQQGLLGGAAAAAAVLPAFDDAGPDESRPTLLPSSTIAHPRIRNIPTLGTLEKQNLSELGSEYLQGMGPGSRCSFLSETDDLVLSSADVASPRLIREFNHLTGILSQPGFLPGYSSGETAYLAQESFDVEALTITGSETVEEDDNQANAHADVATPTLTPSPSPSPSPSSSPACTLAECHSSMHTGTRTQEF